MRRCSELDTLSPVHSAAQRCEPEYMSCVRMNGRSFGLSRVERPVRRLRLPEAVQVVAGAVADLPWSNVVCPARAG